MNVGLLLKNMQKVMIDNSPALLTAIGVTGTITTAVLTGKAAVNAHILVNETEDLSLEHQRRFLTEREIVALTWKLYIPAAGVGLGTIMCIILANRIGTRRTAALAAAYTVSERAFVEYSEKVVEKFGEKEERLVRTELAKDRVNRASEATTATIVVRQGNQLCHEAMTGRFFQSNMEELRRAENNINRQILHENYATVSNFYGNIPDLEDTSTSDELGWNTDKFLELAFDSILVEKGEYKGQTALSFDFAVVPIREPWRFC